MGQAVKFRYKDDNDNVYEQNLPSGRMRSRESCGVWHIEGYAWKIFSTRTQYKRIQDTYALARSQGVPTGALPPIEGIVIDDRGPPKNGFALVSEYVYPPARFFSLAKNTSSFRQAIQSTADDNVLDKIQVALYGAINMRITDPQGFIDPQNVSNPIVFIDLHTHTKEAESLIEMYDLVLARRAALQQLWGQ